MPQVEYGIFSKLLPEVSSEQVNSFDLVISSMPRWTEHSLAGNNTILSIHRNGVGYDMIDVLTLNEKGVMLFITPEAVRKPMAAAILVLILALSMKLTQKERAIRQGMWLEGRNCHGCGQTGKILGSIGVGNIGHEMFKLALPLGMTHMAYDPYITQDAVKDINVQLVDFETVLNESDFMTICCPLNRETFHLIGESELKKMKNSSFLINAARGAIIDEMALITALQNKWIQGAGIDVFEKEPTPKDNPLLKLDNVIVTPHALGMTEECLSNMWIEIHNQISQIIKGEVPGGLVNKDVLGSPTLKEKLKRFHQAIKS